MLVYTVCYGLCIHHRMEDTMTRITCTCKTCKTNAAKLGRPFPLAADVPGPLAKAVGKQTHGLVYDAHNPSAMGAAMRRTTGIVPVTA